jgi:hypothetical protein
LALMLAAVSDTALAGRKTRLFTFEEGTVGATTTTANNSITGPVLDVPDAAIGYPTNYYDAGPEGVPDGTPMSDWAATTYNPSPDFTAASGTPQFVNVANGSPLDSPAAGSNVGLQFNGVNTILTSQGFRGTFLSDAGVAANDAAAEGVNKTTSFTVLAQTWARPDPTGSGTSQVVFSIGSELGGVRITDDGFWELINTRQIGNNKKTNRAVPFGQWTHLAILTTGSATNLYLNGSVAATVSDFYNSFPQEIILGGNITLDEPFKGVVDNFSTVGTAGFGITISTDLDYFSDLGLPAPSGVAGDVDQDGDADQTDYNVWSTNAGFDNTFGVGDLTTLIRGDVDQNGRINFFDFRIIARAATGAGVTLSVGVPEPSGAALVGMAMMAACSYSARRRRCS